MPAPQCRVCRRRTAEYTCPRCNARYCSLDCYRDHSERCTEGFYRDAAVSELRSITAGQDERQHMVDILQRLHQQEVEGGGSSDEGGEDAEDVEEEGGLSNATLHLLLAKMQAAGGVLDVGEQDLTPSELAAFHRALAAGELSAGLQPWQPWWLSEEAMQLELGAAGTSLMAAVSVEEQPRQQQQPHGTSEAAATGSVLPAPPSRPLPRLAALTRAPPSPLLQHQLLDLLYAYCHTLRLYNGEPLCDVEAAADALFALSAVLAAVMQAPAAGGGSGSDSMDAVAPALLACLLRACQPPVGDRDSRGFAIGVLSDVAAVLRLGRPVVLTALMDLSRLLEAARQQLDDGSGQADGGGSGSKQQRKHLRRRLVAAERKLLFFLAWANEQSPEAYDHLAMAAAAEQQKHAAAAVAATGQRPAGAAQPGLLDLSGGTAGSSRGAAAAVLIEELP